MKWSLGLVLLLLLATRAARSAEYSAQPLKEAPPAGDLSEDIAAKLAPTGWKVMQGEKRVVCEIWPAKAWAAKADFAPSDTVFVPLEPGSLVGVLRFTRKGADFRGQEIPAGLYTLRYANQPVDGNHVGTFATRDFLVMLPASADQSAKPITDMDLFKLSAQSAPNRTIRRSCRWSSPRMATPSHSSTSKSRIGGRCACRARTPKGARSFCNRSWWARLPSDSDAIGTRPRL